MRDLRGWRAVGRARRARRVGRHGPARTGVAGLRMRRLTLARRRAIRSPRPRASEIPRRGAAHRPGPSGHHRRDEDQLRDPRQHDPAPAHAPLREVRSRPPDHHSRVACQRDPRCARPRVVLVVGQRRAGVVRHDGRLVRPADRVELLQRALRPTRRAGRGRRCHGAAHRGSRMRAGRLPRRPSGAGSRRGRGRRQRSSCSRGRALGWAPTSSCTTTISSSRCTCSTTSRSTVW